jgi:ligand-binding sensor domain-containing protein
VFAFLALSNGEFWIGTAAGIARYPDVNATTRPAQDLVNEINGLPNPKVRAMAEFSGKVYVATWGGGLGVYDIAGDSWTTLTTADGLLDNYVADVAVSPTENLLYFATNAGVSIYDPAADAFEDFETGDGLLDKLVSAVQVVDNGGTVERWYGPRLDEKVLPALLPFHGITVAKGAATVYGYTTENSGLAEPNVNDIFHDAVRGVFWVAYSTKGIAEVNVPGSTWMSHTMVQGLPSNTVFSLTRAAGTVWAGTQNGLAKLQNGKWQGYNTGGGLQADRVRAVYSDNGERLWVGFVDGGAARVKTD